MNSSNTRRGGSPAPHSTGETMPLSRLSMPKALRDDMRTVLGVDDYRGTPEQLNSDAVIPVYNCNEKRDVPEEIFRGGAYAQVEPAGLTHDEIGVWCPTTLIDPSLYSNLPSRLDCALILPVLSFELYLNIAGRAALVAAGARIKAKLILSQNAVEEKTGMTMREWIYQITAGVGFVYEGRTNLFSTPSTSSTWVQGDRPRMFGNLSLGDPKGLRLDRLDLDINGYYLTFDCETEGYAPTAFPASTVIRVYSWAKCIKVFDW